MELLNLRKTGKGSIGRRLQYVHMGWLQRLHRFARRFRKINQKQIVFESFNGSKYNDSPRAIYEAMLADKRFNKYSFIWALQDPDGHPYLRRNRRTTVVQHGSRQYFQAYAGAKYWVVNAMLTLSIAKQQNKQVMLQCWHGTPLKRLRNDIIENTAAALDLPSDLEHKNNLDTQRYDYFVSPSRYATRHFTTAFNLKELGKQDSIIETGYPRNDFLVTHKKSDVRNIRKRLGLPAGKKVILYAPTWRDDQYDPEVGFVYQLPLDLEALRDSLADEYVLLIRLHYFVAGKLDLGAYKGFAYNVSLDDNINDLYIISDVLVTDYSSVFFDYANLKRPMLFYMYDKQHYEYELRGFYLSPDKLPGDIVTTQAELVARLADLKAYTARTQQAIAAFHEEFNYLDDGKATERVINTVWFDSSR